MQLSGGFYSKSTNHDLSALQFVEILAFED